MRNRSITRWLIIANLIVVATAVYFAGDSFGWWQSFDWESWLGIKMQGPEKTWFYFGVALLTGGPIAAIPFYVKRYCQKRCCRGCGRQHIQRF